MGLLQPGEGFDSVPGGQGFVIASRLEEKQCFYTSHGRSAIGVQSHQAGGIISLAIDALEMGIDGPATLQLAGLIRPSGYEIDRYPDGFLAEVGLRRISIEFAAARLAQNIARKVVYSGENPSEVLPEFERLWIAASYPASITDLAMLNEDVRNFYEEGSAKARKMVLECLKEFAELPDVP